MDELEREIVEKLQARDEASSICPSEVARDVGDADTWRDLMQPVRDAARALAQHGVVRITQGNNEVDIDTAKGPIRIRRGAHWGE